MASDKKWFVLRVGADDILARVLNGLEDNGITTVSVLYRQSEDFGYYEVVCWSPYPLSDGAAAIVSRPPSMPSPEAKPLVEA